VRQRVGARLVVAGTPSRSQGTSPAAVRLPVIGLSTARGCLLARSPSSFRADPHNQIVAVGFVTAALSRGFRVLGTGLPVR